MELQEVELTDLFHAFPEEFHKLTADQQHVSLQLYRTLAEGLPVSPARVATTLGLAEPAVQAILEGWPGVYYDDERRVIGYWGLSLDEMDYRFEVEEKILYTWCAWDSLFLPELIHMTARVTSSCPVTGVCIWLTVSPEGIQECHPAESVLSFLKPQAGRFRQDVIQHFCHYVHFFSSPDVGAQWVAQHEGTFLLSLNQAEKLARWKNRAQYGGLTEIGICCRA